IDPTDTQEAVEAALLGSPILPVSEWPAVAAALAAGSGNDCEQAARFSALQAATGSARVEAYVDIFCTAERQPRNRGVTRLIASREPDLAQRLVAEQERVCALLVRRRAVATRDRTAALLTIAGEVIARYRGEKERRGLLDYDDLIDKTLAMLTTVNPSWVHYKLDLGIDHLLID